MALLAREFIEEVKAANPIEQVIGEDVDLKVQGSVLMGRSPFKPERNPSFCVWPGSGHFKDYAGGGGPSGDVIAYVMERDGIGFPSALIKLATRAGIEPPAGEEREALRQLVRVARDTHNVRQTLKRAMTYFNAQLTAEQRTFLHQRYGLTDETIDHLLIGFAPADGGCFKHLIDSGVSRDDALATGLFSPAKKSKRVFPFFKGRLVFAYWKAGEVVYAIARQTERTPDDEYERGRKYKKLLTACEGRPHISPAIRNEHFYGEDSVVGAETVLITEGITDAIILEQAGFAVISPVTTSFREQDIPRMIELTRNAKRIFIVNDNEVNGCGEEGAKKTAQALFAAGRDVRLAELPRPDGVEKVDVNDYMRGHTADEFEREVLSSALSLPEHLIVRIPADTPPAELADALMAPFRLVAEGKPLVRDALLKAAHARFGVAKSALNELMKDAKAQMGQGAAEHGRRMNLLDAVTEDEKNGVYLKQIADGPDVILSSFIIIPKKRIQTAETEVLEVDLKGDDGRVRRGHRLPREAFRGRRDFVAALPSADFQIVCGDDDVQSIQRLVAKRPATIHRGVQALGLFDDDDSGPVWVGPEVNLTTDGPTSQKLVPIGVHSALAGRLRYANPSEATTRALAKKVLPLLLNVNLPSVVLPILGWMMLAPLKPRMLQLIGHLSHLLVWGSMGSGKTSLSSAFARLHGVIGGQPFSATDTPFAMLKLFSSSRSVPIVIDEYKPSELGAYRVGNLHRLLRRSYSGDTESRGRANLTLDSYEVAAPICLVGEAPPDGDPAVMERFICASPKKPTLQVPRYKRAFKALTRLPLEDLAVPLITFLLQREVAPYWKCATTLVDKVIAQKLKLKDAPPPRVYDNVACMCMGLLMFDDWAASLGVTVKYPVVEGIKAALSNVSGGEKGGVKDAFDRFLEACATYAAMDLLREGIHYAWVGGELCLHLGMCHEVYLQERKRTSQPDETNGRAALRRFISEKIAARGYVKQADRRVDLEGGSLRTVAIDPEAVPDHIDLEGFPKDRVRTHGGTRTKTPHLQAVGGDK